MILWVLGKFWNRSINLSTRKLATAAEWEKSYESLETPGNAMGCAGELSRGAAAVDEGVTQHPCGSRPAARSPPMRRMSSSRIPNLPRAPTTTTCSLALLLVEMEHVSWMRCSPRRRTWGLFALSCILWMHRASVPRQRDGLHSQAQMQPESSKKAFFCP